VDSRRFYPLSRLVGDARILGQYLQPKWIQERLRARNRPREGHHFINERIHQSAFDRWKKDSNYRPPNLAAAKEQMPKVSYSNPLKVKDYPLHTQ